MGRGFWRGLGDWRSSERTVKTFKKGIPEVSRLVEQKQKNERSFQWKDPGPRHMGFSSSVSLVLSGLGKPPAP